MYTKDYVTVTLCWHDNKTESDLFIVGIPLFTPKVKKNIAYIVMAVLFDDDDRVVLVQEAKSSCKGSWYLPAGRVEKGENLLVCFNPFNTEV